MPQLDFALMPRKLYFGWPSDKLVSHTWQYLLSKAQYFIVLLIRLIKFRPVNNPTLIRRN